MLGALDANRKQTENTFSHHLEISSVYAVQFLLLKQIVCFFKIPHQTGIRIKTVHVQPRFSVYN